MNKNIEVYIIRTEKTITMGYYDTEPFQPRQKYLVNEYEGVMVEAVSSKEYPIIKLCHKDEGGVKTRNYVFTDPFLQKIVTDKSRAWNNVVQINTNLLKTITRLRSAADERREEYSFILAHPFKYAMRRLFKLEAPKGSIL